MLPFIKMFKMYCDKSKRKKTPVKNYVQYSTTSA